LALFLVSFGISMLLVKDPDLGKNKVEAVVVQPNIDPYLEKFGGMPPGEQIDKMIALAKEKLTAKTDYLIFPETAIPEAHWEHEMEYLYAVEELRKLNAISPNVKIVIGSSSSILYTPGEKLSATANAFRDGTGHYDNYNSAWQIDSSKNIQRHYRSIWEEHLEV